MANSGNLFPRTTRLSSWSKRRRSAKWGSLSFRGTRSHCNHNLWWYFVSPPHQTLYVMVMIQPGSASNPHLWSKAYLLVSLMVFGLCNLQPSSHPFPSGVLLLSLILLIRPTGTSLKEVTPLAGCVTGSLPWGQHTTCSNKAGGEWEQGTWAKVPARANLATQLVALLHGYPWHCFQVAEPGVPRKGGHWFHSKTSLLVAACVPSRNDHSIIESLWHDPMDPNIHPNRLNLTSICWLVLMSLRFTGLWWLYTHGESTIDREQSQATACPHGALNETQPGSNALHWNPTRQILIPQHPEVLFHPVSASICFHLIRFQPFPFYSSILHKPWKDLSMKFIQVTFIIPHTS